MIIECPRCGFSGRVPNYVAAVPHHARCPKCQFRFDLGELAGESTTGAGAHDLRHDLTRPRLDPSSSSYEIEAITEGFSPDDEDERGSQEWDEDRDGVIEPDAVATTAGATSTVDHPRLAFHGEDPSAARLALLGSAPWRIRLFQSWAVLFIAWAALIGFRAVLATISRDEEFLFSMATIWPVASVVLLVTASACLFLLIDVSRRLATLADPSSSRSLLPPQGGAGLHPHGPIDPIAVKPVGKRSLS